MFEKEYLVDPKDVYVDSTTFVNISSRKLPVQRWTNVAASEEYMNHLLNLFFTWDNGAERSIFRPIFEEDIAGLDPDSVDNGPGAFCSRFLVNSLLAISCVSRRFCKHINPD